MKKNKLELELIKNFVDSAYNSFGNLLIVDGANMYGPENPEIGYCYKFTDSNKNVVYRIVRNKIGHEHTDFRVLMHEYGHLYLGHLDGIHEELDSRICNVLKNFRGDLIDRVNKECGIDFADKLISRVIDDPALNHSLHNIAMDMEINSTILSLEDIEEMEQDISDAITPKKDIVDALEESKKDAEDEDAKTAIDEAINNVKTEMTIKFMVPDRYYTAPDKPFPSGLRYPEYLLLMVKHLDQFVKMLVSIKNGGNGDTSKVTQQQVMDALSKKGDGQGQGQGDGEGDGQGQGSGSPSMEGFDELMKDLGLSDASDLSGDGNVENNSKESGSSGNSGTRGNGDGEDESNKSGRGGDHGTESRKEADAKRELGQIRASGGVGCGSSSGNYMSRSVIDLDPIDLGLEEVINNFKSKVLKMESKRDMTYLYNRGINRTVIAPCIRRKALISTEPTIVFLIDVSGSMDTALIDRVLKTISLKMRKINRGLKYNIITWCTRLNDHLKDIDPKKPVPRIGMGGGTRMAEGMKYFKDHYDENAILILISDFEDYLEEWHKVEKTMPNYLMYGFNYGRQKCNQSFKYFKVKECQNTKKR